jgi:hypothetical protein
MSGKSREARSVSLKGGFSRAANIRETALAAEVLLVADNPVFRDVVFEAESNHHFTEYSA